MTLALAIDTSTPAVSVAIGRLDRATGTTVLAREVLVDARAHAEQLTPLIRTALDRSGIAPGDLGAVVAGLGPGPFTGLRVGLVTAAAMGHALGIPCYGQCSLDAIGATVAGTDPVLVATDARRKEIYWGLYASGRRLAGPGVAKPANLPPEAAAAVRATGAGAVQYASTLGLPLVDGHDHPDPAELLTLAAERILTGRAGDDLTPLYLRRPDVHVAAPATPTP